MQPWLNLTMPSVMLVLYQKAPQFPYQGNIELISRNKNKFRQKVSISLETFMAGIEKKNSHEKYAQSNRLKVLDSYLHICAYCGLKSNNLTIDHVVPISEGGSNDVSNMVPACKKCNSVKGNQSLIIFLNSPEFKEIVMTRFLYCKNRVLYKKYIKKNRNQYFLMTVKNIGNRFKNVKKELFIVLKLIKNFSKTLI